MKLLQYWRDVRASLWFVPGLCVLASVVFAIALVRADSHLQLDWLGDWPLVFGSGAAGARGLLTTVASSMITIVGVVFSITIVALSLASSQYTSRVLRNFMSDTANQLVLGIFVGIFAYCLVVMRTIRGGEEAAFVSPLAVLFALVLAFVGIGVLIFFIHHISISIQAAHILAAVSWETERTIERLYPKGLGPEEEADDFEPDQTGKAWRPVIAAATGYLQSVDVEGLVGFAAERKTVVRMDFKIGQFVIAGSPLRSVLAAAEPDEEDRERLESFVAVGRQRTVEQDVSFGIRQIVDVALKALSPGINDTTTAVMCVNYLTFLLAQLTVRRIETRHCDEDGEVRLLTSGPTYESLVGESFDQIRQNAAGNVAVLEALYGALEALARRTSSPSRRRILSEHAEALGELTERSVPAPRDQRVLREYSRKVTTLLG